jgi:pilus assembly protein Flp/PilA
MRGVILKIHRFLASEEGPTAAEYAVMLGVITVGLVATISALASNVSGTLSSVSSTVGGS